jgi:hypothetical protein
MLPNESLLSVKRIPKTAGSVNLPCASSAADREVDEQVAQRDTAVAGEA